jgi:hypothetical protein
MIIRIPYTTIKTVKLAGKPEESTRDATPHWNKPVQQASKPIQPVKK